MRLNKIISNTLKLRLNNKNLSKYFLFLFISLFFWFLSMLSKEHETTLLMPVKYDNYPADQVLVSTPINFVELRIKATGFSILSHRFFNSSVLTLDVIDANVKPVKNGREVFWLLNSKRKSVAEIISASMQLIVIKPQRLAISFRNKEKKKVRVKLKEAITLRSEIWYVNPITLVPDSVTIYGNTEELDKIDVINTKELLLENIYETSTKSIDLDIPPSLYCEKSNIDVKIELEPFVEQSFKCIIGIKNMKNNFVLKLFPEYVNVTVRFPKDKYDLFRTNFLRPYVNVASISGEDKRIVVQIENLPSFIKLQRIYPSSLEFLLIKE